MSNSITVALTLNVFVFYFTASILLKPSFAETTSADIFTTKSGRKIHLGSIRRYIQLSNESNLEYMIFEYDASSNKLFSFHHSIYLPNRSNHSRIYLSPNVKLFGDPSVDDESGPLPRKFTSRNVSNIYMSTLENGDTFLFDADKNHSLIGAFGDALDLHSINNRHEVFINHFKISNSDKHMKASPKQKVCNGRYEYSLRVISDPLMSKRFGYEKIVTFFMIEQFILQSVKMFRDVACIDIHLIAITSLGTATKDLYFHQKQCTNPHEAQCETTQTDHIMQQMNSYTGELKLQERELMLFISGLNNAGSLAGLAYKSRACELKLSKIWIRGLSQVALYHEIGHLFGANHARNGIMQPNVVIADDIKFSSRSYNEINHFVEKDSRSWCLRRKYSSSYADVLKDGWRQKKILLSMPGTELTSINNGNVYLLSLSKGTDHGLCVLVTTSRRNSFVGKQKLFYGYIKSIWSSYRIQGRVKIEFKSLGSESRNYSNFKLRFFTAKGSGARVVILSYLYSDYANRRKIPYYKVGSVNNYGDIDINSWSKERIIDDADLPNDRFTDVDMGIGNIRNEQSLDVLHMQLGRDRKSESIYEFRSLNYKIGFNVSASGIANSGWSDYFSIPGDFSKSTSISVSVMDIDGNGRPDLVINIVELEYTTTNRSHNRLRTYSYFRVGKDLSTEGMITGGWTDYMMASIERNMFIVRQSMAVGRDLETDQLALTLGHQLPNGEIDLRFSRTDVFKKAMKTTKKYSAIETVSGSCENCFNGNLKEIGKCQRKLNLCKSQIEELRIFQDTHYLKQSEVIVHGSKINSVDYLTQVTNRYYLNTTSNSLYCTGFQYFLDTDNVCNTIEAKSVYSKGLEINFITHLNETIKEEDIKSTSLFEDTLGTYGNGLPIIVQAEIRGRKSPTKKQIRKALEKSLARKQLPSKHSYSVLGRKTGKSLYKTKMRWRKKQRVWIVTFSLSTAGIDVF